MIVIYLLVFLHRYVFCRLAIENTDLNETVEYIVDVDATFGGRFHNGQKAYLYESDPLLACGDRIEPPFEMLNTSDIRLVVLIKRGNCTFDHKVFLAQEAGFQGALVYNNLNNGIFAMSSDDSSTNTIIPSRMVSLSDGYLMRQFYTYTKSRQNFLLIFYDNSNFNPQYYIIAFLGFICLGFFIIGIGFGIKLCRDVIKRRANRLRQCHLKKIPIKKFVKGQDPFETCAICLDDFKDGDKLRILPCNHAYHSFCIDPWLLKQKRNCPICKNKIKIPGRDDDSDSVDGTSPVSQAINTEQTPLINPQNTNPITYLSNSELDVHFVPEPNSVTSTCYENVNFEKEESERGPCNNTDISSINCDQEQPSDLTKIV